MELKVTPLFRRIYGVKKRIIFLRGGARSSKSFSVMQMMTLWLWTGWMGDRYIPEGNFTVVRATFPSLRASVMKDFINYLIDMNLYNYVNHKKTVHEFHVGKRQVDFISADDEQKLRGRKHTFAWLEEINDMAYDVFTQIIIRLEHQLFMTVNPSGFPWGKTEIEDKRMPNIGDVHLDVSTYHDNPFLSENIKTEIESLKLIDKDLYNIYSKGVWTKMKGLIFPDWEFYSETPSGLPYRSVIGLDFGFTHPMAIVEVKMIGDSIFVEELYYEREKTTADLIEFLKPFGKSLIVADNSRPETIRELRNNGFNVRPSRKGKDSVKNSIITVKMYNMFVKETSLNLINELRRYKWAEDKDGNLKQEEPVKIWDDLCDAMRYAVVALHRRARVNFLLKQNDSF